MVDLCSSFFLSTLNISLHFWACMVSSREIYCKIYPFPLTSSFIYNFLVFCSGFFHFPFFFDFSVEFNTLRCRFFSIYIAWFFSILPGFVVWCLLLILENSWPLLLQICLFNFYSNISYYSNMSYYFKCHTYVAF